MLKRLRKWLGVLLAVQAAIFGVITGYDQLTEGTLSTWLIGRGWSIDIVVVLYWGSPIVLYIAGETIKAVVARSWRLFKDRYSRWKLERAIHSYITAEKTLVAISRAGSRGLLSKGEGRALERVARDLEPIEFEILKLCNDPTGWAEKHNIQYPQWATARRSQLFEFAIPPLKGQEEHYDYFIKRLQAKHLLLLGPDALNIVLPKNELLRPITTPLGHKLAYLIGKCEKEK